jgi:regulator of G-protein signaling
LTDGASLFTAFLKKEYAHENIEFWIEVENYRKARPSKFTSKAKKIFEEYIAVKSPKEVRFNTVITAITASSSILSQFDPSNLLIE